MKNIALEVRKQFTEGDIKRDAGNTTPADIERFDDIVYGTDAAWQSLDVYRPRDLKGKLPVIISFHGGGWVYGSKEVYQWYTMSLAQRGFAVINFTYRLAPEFQFPSPLEDMNLVVEWMLDNAEKYGLDTKNVFAVGDSAGGHGIALYNCILTNPVYAANFAFQAPKGFRFNAVGLNCGAYKIVMDSEKPDLTAALMNDYLRSGTNDAELIQVLNHITKDFPPSFVMTCDGDFLKNDAGLLVPVLLENNVETELHFYTGKKEPLGHVFHCNIKMAEADICNDEECAFFRKHLR